MENEKIVFKCKHCENDDLRYMQFFSLNKQSPQYMNSIYKQNWDYETTPKIPIGIHIKCAKCGKDTIIIPDMYSATQWTNDIPKQCLVSVKYEKPQFSAIQYVMNDEGYLDKIVITANNQKVSMITEKVLDDESQVSVIGKKQYDLLLSRGLQEVRKDDVVLQQSQTTRNIEHTKEEKYNKGSDKK